MTPSPDQARALADALDAVFARLERIVSLDDLLRAVDLGDRLVATDAQAELAQAWQESRTAVVTRLVARASDPSSWEPLDELGDALLDGRQAEELVQWGMALLRVARILPLLPPERRALAAAVVARGVDRIRLLPATFLPLVGLAADRIELEGTQPQAVQRLLDHMLEIPILLAEDARVEAQPPRLDLVRRLRQLTPQPVVVTGEAGGAVVFLRAPAARMPDRLAAADGALAEPAPDAWVTAWHDDTASLSVAELSDAAGRAWVLLSVVAGLHAPAEVALDRPDAVRLEGEGGHPVPAVVERATEEEWRARIEGRDDLVVRLAWRTTPLIVRFDRPQGPP